jgi:transposase
VAEADRTGDAHCDPSLLRCHHHPGTGPKNGKIKDASIAPPNRGVVVRNGRPYQGSDRPAVVYFYSPDRKGENPRAFMKGFNGVLQADGFSGFNALDKPNRTCRLPCSAG